MTPPDTDVGEMPEHEQTLQRLLAQLHSNDVAAREAAVRALGHLGDARAVEPLLARVHDADEDAEVRIQAALALGALGDRSASGPLLTFLESQALMLPYQEVTLCAYVIDALGLLAEARAVDPLLSGLDHEDIDIRKASWQALARIGEPAVLLLIEALGDTSRRGRWFIVDALGRIGDSRAIAPLRRLLDDPTTDQYVRGAVASALGRLHAEQSFAILISLLHTEDETSFVRQEAATGLGLLGDARALPALRQAARHAGNEPFARAIAQAIEQIEQRGSAISPPGEDRP